MIINIQKYFFMKTISVFFSRYFVFKQWTNAAYGVFNSLGLQIRIAILLPVYVMAWQNTTAQTDTLNLDKIEVNSLRTQKELMSTAQVIRVITSQDIEELPVTSISDILELTVSADIRQRGAQDIQADVSLRGGSFEQVLILLNGQKINDSQTGHHNLNLPVPLEAIERIEILEGPGGREFGANSYTGAINFITKVDKFNKLKISTLYGQNGRYAAASAIHFGVGKFRNMLAGNFAQSDGYLFKNEVNNTDYEKFSIFWHGNYELKSVNLQFQAGYSDKAFGANGFYSPKYPWQFEHIRTSFGAFSSDFKLKHPIKLSAFARQNNDYFELFREDRYSRNGSYFIFQDTDTAKFSSGIYEAWNYYKGHNYHQTNTYGIELKQNFHTNIGITSVGFEYRFDRILSNVLGEASDTVTVPFDEYGMFTKRKLRTNYTAYLQHTYNLQKFRFSVGLAATSNLEFGLHHTAGADVLYKISPKISTYISANQAIRLPTFTDLYYSGPSNIGNPDLEPEESLAFEIGTKYRNKGTSANFVVYNRLGTNTIDWGRISETDKWQSMNLAKLTTYGIETNLSHRFEKKSILRTISVSYAFIYTDKQSQNYYSNYSLDYLKHKAIFACSHQIWENFGASWNLRYENREGTYTQYLNLKYEESEYQPFILTDLKLFWKNAHVELYAEATNLTNVQYFEIGGVQMPGRWITGGVKLFLSKL